MNKTFAFWASCSIALGFSTSLQAATVFSDNFSYTVNDDFVAQGGWTNISLAGIHVTNGTGVTWGQFGTIDYNYATALSVGDTIEATASVNRFYTGSGNSYSYIVELFLWDGANAGTMTSVAGGNIAATQANLSSGSYQVSAADITNGLDHVVFRYGHNGNTGGAGNGAGWGETTDVTLDVTASTVPEPSSTALIGLGGLAFLLRRRK